MHPHHQPYPQQMHPHHEQPYPQPHQGGWMHPHHQPQPQQWDPRNSGGYGDPNQAPQGPEKYDKNEDKCCSSACEYLLGGLFLLAGLGVGVYGLYLSTTSSSNEAAGFVGGGAGGVVIGLLFLMSAHERTYGP